VRISVGIGVAKEVHWAPAVTEFGEIVLDRKIENTADDIAAFIGEFQAASARLASTCWAARPPSWSRCCWLPASVWSRSQASPSTARGRAMSVASARASKNARVIADQVRIRHDLRPIAPEPDIVAELRLLAGHRPISPSTRRAG
jgi:hypothetical protein